MVVIMIFRRIAIFSVLFFAAQASTAAPSINKMQGCQGLIDFIDFKLNPGGRDNSRWSGLHNVDVAVHHIQERRKCAAISKVCENRGHIKVFHFCNLS